MSFKVKIDTLTSLLYFQQNCKTAVTLISTHLMSFLSMKQSLIISSTGFFQVYLLTQKLRIFTFIYWVNQICFNYCHDSKHVSEWLHLSGWKVNLLSCIYLFQNISRLPDHCHKTQRTLLSLQISRIYLVTQTTFSGILESLSHSSQLQRLLFTISQ